MTNTTAKKWYCRQPWKFLAFVILLVIGPVTFGVSILLLFGLYGDDLRKPII